MWPTIANQEESPEGEALRDIGSPRYKACSRSPAQSRVNVYWLFSERLRVQTAQSASQEQQTLNWTALRRCAACLRAGAAEGFVLRHPTDVSLGNVCNMIPECNLRDIVDSGPDFLLDLQPAAGGGFLSDLIVSAPEQKAALDEKLAELNESHPTARGRMEESEADTLNDLAVVVGFIQDQVDLLDFALPIDSLLEPGMSEGAPKELDQFVIDKVGTKMRLLYEDLMHKCFAVLEKQYQLAKAKMEDHVMTEQQQNMDWTPIRVPAPLPREERLEQRRQKAKTRPAHSSVYEITPAAAPPAAESSTPSPRTFEVSASAAEVFSTLFDKGQSRGAVNKADFDMAAMVGMGFSVLPKFRSVYTLLPPESMGVKQ
ncbi:hypothetical protein VTI74DRAFT_10424 [Chaetomium olivicolor]